MNVDVYWSHSFIGDLIRADGVVIDVGMNDGGFARRVAPFCKKVIAFEPDPRWHSITGLPLNVLVIPKAVAARSGRVRFNVNRHQCSSLHYAEDGATQIEVDAITLDEALQMVPGATIDLVKIDVEGAELDILLTTPAAVLERIAQLTVEFHDFIDPRAVSRIREVITRMQALGFFTVCFSFRSYGDTLFLNPRLVPLGAWQRLWLIGRYKYLRGAWRVVSRMMRR